MRIEFWGDEIDSMGYFDVSDQRRTEAIRCCTILPAAETLPSLTVGGIEALCRQIESFAERFAKKRSSENAATLAATLRGDAERLRGGVVLSDADRYLPVLYPAASGLQYIPEDALVFLDQPARCAERARDYMKQLTEDLRELQKRGQVAVSADGFYESWDAVVKRLADFPVYMADAFTVGRTPLPPKTLVSIPAKQLPSYAGSAQAAAEDVKLYLKQDYRVVVLAGDERRAKVLQDFFKEHEIPALFDPEMKKLPTTGQCRISIGALSAGIEYPGIKLAILTDAQLIRKKNKKAPRQKKLPANRQRIESYADLSVGDYVVHENHGIGRFAGIVKMQVDGFEKDYVKIKLRRHRQPLCPGHPAGPGDQVHRRRRGKARQALQNGRHRVGQDPLPRQERGQGHGQEAHRPLCRAAAAARAMPSRRTASGSGSLRTTSATPRPTISSAAWRRSRRTWSPPCPWTGCSAATWASARPRWPCGR